MQACQSIDRDARQRVKVIDGLRNMCGDAMYSTSRYMEYMHANNMNEERELISCVWFLLSFMGMETFADRF
jgi:hypothetical protein